MQIWLFTVGDQENHRWREQKDSSSILDVANDSLLLNIFINSFNNRLVLMTSIFNLKMCES